MKFYLTGQKLERVDELETIANNSIDYTEAEFVIDNPRFKEREINAFVPENYYEIDAYFNDFNAKLDSYNHKKIEIKTEIDAKEIVSKLSNTFKISSN